MRTIARTVRSLAFTREECVAMSAAALLALVVLIGGIHNVASTGQWGGGAPETIASTPSVAVDQSTEIPGYVDPTVVVIPIDAVSPTFRDALLAAGFHGDPTDDQEAIIAPQTAAMSLCATDLDCSYASGAVEASVGH